VAYFSTALTNGLASNRYANFGQLKLGATRQQKFISGSFVGGGD
jgi:hypothetical protein